MKYNYRQSGWLCTRWGEITQCLKFKYLYKRGCKCSELLLVCSDFCKDLNFKCCVISPHLCKVTPIDGIHRHSFISIKVSRK